MVYKMNRRGWMMDLRNRPFIYLSSLIISSFCEQLVALSWGFELRLDTVVALGCKLVDTDWFWCIITTGLATAPTTTDEDGDDCRWVDVFACNNEADDDDWVGAEGRLIPRDLPPLFVALFEFIIIILVVEDVICGPNSIYSLFARRSWPLPISYSGSQ